MKNVEAIIPHLTVPETVDHLQELQVEDLTVESVNVFKKDNAQTMIFRGHEYKSPFTSESKIRFSVSEEDAAEAEAIVAHASHH